MFSGNREVIRTLLILVEHLRTRIADLERQHDAERSAWSEERTHLTEMLVAKRDPAVLREVKRDSQIEAMARLQAARVASPPRPPRFISPPGSVPAPPRIGEPMNERAAAAVIAASEEESSA